MMSKQRKDRKGRMLESELDTEDAAMEMDDELEEEEEWRYWQTRF